MLLFFHSVNSNLLPDVVGGRSGTGLGRELWLFILNIHLIFSRETSVCFDCTLKTPHLSFFR